MGRMDGHAIMGRMDMGEIHRMHDLYAAVAWASP